MWFMSLVGQMWDKTQSSASSDVPGQVFAFGRVAPFERPRVRFFCMSFSFDTKCLAESMGYEFVSACRWGRRDGRSPKLGEGGEVICNMWSMRTPVSA